MPAGMRKLIICNLLVGLGAMVMTGCVAKSTAQAQARAAFMAGRNQGLSQAQPAQPPQFPAVTVLGNVKFSNVPWTVNMTVAKAIVEAEYLGAGDPTDIIVSHNGEVTNVNPARLLKGDDMPLDVGDRVEIRP